MKQLIFPNIIDEPEVENEMELSIIDQREPG